MKRFFYFSFFILVGCHSSVKKEATQNIPKKDTVKSVVKTESPKAKPAVYVILDTVVKRDTLKVVLYNDTMIRCSLNNLSDAISVGMDNIAWDAEFIDYNDAPMIVPGQAKPRRFILNDSLLIIPAPTCAPTGGTLLFLLNRTKHSLKFAKYNNVNPILHRPYYIYVDLKNNTIINHDYREIYDDGDVGDNGEEHGRYLIYRYKISDKHFVQTDVVASYDKGFDKLDMFDPTYSTERAFYNSIVKYENWERDRYDSNNYQKVITVDTIIGKDTINIAYDNKGNLIGNINRKYDTLDLGEKWEGYEWWRNKDCHRLIVPGEKKPRSFILNDSLLLFALANSSDQAELFMFTRKDTTLDSNFIDDGSNYIYVDSRRNKIIDYIDAGEDAEHAKEVPCWFNSYRIHKADFERVERVLFSIEGDYTEFPSSFEDSRDFYKVIAKIKSWKRVPSSK